MPKPFFEEVKGFELLESHKQPNIVEKKRRSAVPFVTGLQDGAFLFSTEKEMCMEKEANSGDRPARENYRQLMRHEDSGSAREHLRKNRFAPSTRNAKAAPTPPTAISAGGSGA